MSDRWTSHSASEIALEDYPAVGANSLLGNSARGKHTPLKTQHFAQLTWHLSFSPKDGEILQLK